MINEQKQSKIANNEIITLSIQKGKLRGVQKQINSLQNRIQLLRKQEQKQRTRLQKNKQKTKELIDKKLEINQLLKNKSREHAKEIQTLEVMRKRNLQKKHQQQKSIRNILQACYLVKLDEAREIKNMSLEHQKKIKQIKNEIYTQNKQKHMSIKSMKNRSRQNYEKFKRSKILNIYLSNEEGAQLFNNIKQQKSRYLKSLQEQQIKLLENINKIHGQTIQTKKDMITASNIPVNQISELYQSNIGKESNRQVSKSQKFQRDQQLQNNNELNKIEKIPKTHLNEEKLKLVLANLKKHNHKQYL